MKRKFTILLFALAMAMSMTACSFNMTCKVSGCNETELYEDGYCKYHYYRDAGEGLLKDIINWN